MQTRTTKIAVRRREVARLLLARNTQQEIAAELGVSLATVGSDVAVLRSAWLADTHAEREEEVAQECRLLDADEALWRAKMAELIDKDPALAVRIYDRIDGISARRLQWKRLVGLGEAGLLAGLSAELDRLDDEGQHPEGPHLRLVQAVESEQPE
ncbi:MAG: hypothetical protein ACR2M0_08510 [Chloroflexia bacterium]